MPQYITLHRNGGGYLAGSIVTAGSQDEAVAKKQATLKHVKVLAVSDAIRNEGIGQFFVTVEEVPSPQLKVTNRRVAGAHGL